MHNFKKRPLRTGVLILVVLATISGCASHSIRDYCKPLSTSDLERPSDIKNLPLEDVLKRHDLAKENAIYALFSYNAYPKKTQLKLPQGWKVFPSSTSKTEGVKGFAAKTYLKLPDGDRTQRTVIVFAFKGTDNFWDWVSGNIGDDEYGEANDYVSSTLAELSKAYPKLFDNSRNQKIKVISTGHSLGGGIAGHIAYCFANYNVHAIAFNTSPRNHKGDCENKIRIDEQYSAREPSSTKIIRDQRIQLLHQHYDILSPLRYGITLFVGDKYNDTKYYFTHGSWFGRHDIAPLVVGLYSYAARPLPVDTRDPRAKADTEAKKIYAEICPISSADNQRSK